MTTNLLSVIEQQHKALEMLQGKLTGNVNGADESCFIISMKNQVSYAQMERVSEAIAAGQQALEQTQGEATDWRKQAIAWIRGKAAEQAQTNQKYPRHAECYPSWVEKVHTLERLAGDLEAESESPPFGLEPWQAAHPQATEPAPNPWKDAVLNQLAAHCMDAPKDATPADILERIICMAVLMATDPAISEPAPKRPPNCGTGHCSCIECVMEPAPRTAGEAYDDKCCAGMKPGRVMQRAHAMCPTHMPHVDRMAWMADYFLRNYAALLSAPALPDHIPEAGKMVGEVAAQPEQAARYIAVCANGCGECGVKLAEFEYERTETLEGELIGRKVRPQIVSTCCGAEVGVYDDKDIFWTEFQIDAHPPAQPATEPPRKLVEQLVGALDKARDTTYSDTLFVEFKAAIEAGQDWLNQG